MKEIIKLLLREELINEKASAGSVICYHRTRNPNPKTYNSGFDAGKGDMYGRGLYATYDLESQKTPEMRRLYGDYIIQFQITDLKKFIILDKRVQTKVFGREKSIKDQLKSVMGGFYNEFIKVNKERLLNLGQKTHANVSSVDNSGGYELTSSDAYHLSQCTGFIEHVDGMIFTGRNDGQVALIYNVNIANPLQYSDDDGETWKNLKDVSSHKIGRDTRSVDKNISNFQHSSKSIADKFNDYQYMDELLSKLHPSEISKKLPEDKFFEFLNVYAEHAQNNNKVKQHGLDKMMFTLNDEEFKTIQSKLPQYYKLHFTYEILKHFEKNPEIITQLFGNDAINNVDNDVIFRYLYSNLNTRALNLVGKEKLSTLDKHDLDQLKVVAQRNPNKFIYNTLDDLSSNQENDNYNSDGRRTAKLDRLQRGLTYEFIDIKKLLRENLLTKKETDIQQVSDFVNFAKDYLYIDDDIKIALAFERTPDLKTTAYYSLNGFVKVYVKDRAIIDVLRSIAHELVHHKQNLEGRLKDAVKDGEDGSDIENEANAMAGEIIRKYGKLRPDLYD